MSRVTVFISELNGILLGLPSRTRKFEFLKWYICRVYAKEERRTGHL